MSVSRRQVRPFDQCGIGNPISAQFDLDQDEREVSLGALTHDFAGTKPQKLGVAQGSRFFFFVNGQSTPVATVVAGASVAFAVDAGLVKELARAGANPVTLKEAVTLWRTGGEPVKVEVHATVRLFRSGPPQPAIRIDIAPKINLLADVSADGYLQIGTIFLSPSEPAIIECEGRADFTARVALRAFAQTLPVSVRRYRLDDDEQGSWLADGGADIVDPLDLIVTENRFRTDRFDIAVPYDALCLLVRSNRARAPDGAFVLAIEVDAGLSRDDGERKVIEKFIRHIEVEGRRATASVFSGLCGMPAKRLALAPQALQPSRFDSRPCAPASIAGTIVW